MMRATQGRTSRIRALGTNRAEERELPPLPVAFDLREPHAPQPPQLLADRREQVRRVVVGRVDAERGEELRVELRRRRRDVLEVEERPPGPQALVDLAVQGVLACVRHVVDREAAHDQVERSPVGGERIVEVVGDDVDAVVAGEAGAGAGQHLGGEVGRGRPHAGAQLAHQREGHAVAGAEVEHALDLGRQELRERGHALRPVRDLVPRAQVGARVLCVDPAVLGHRRVRELRRVTAHGPTTRSRSWRGRSRSRTTLLTAARYARAEASTTSVDTPRPLARVPSASSWTTTSPSASPPSVTDDTWKSVIVPVTPVACAMASIAASIIPLPAPLPSTLPSPSVSTTDAD